MPDDNTGIRTWDLLIRLFHWMLVAAVSIAWVLEDDWMRLHVLAGYMVLGLMLFRIVWGVIGTRNARFSSFLCSPSCTLSYLKDVITFRARRYLGHNPAGGAMVVALLFSLSATAITGLALYGYAEFSGPLTDLMAGSPDWLGGSLEDTHEFLANLSMLLVLLHVAGVGLASLQHRENLVRSMFTGIKQKELS
jgi:cytochrome b